MKHLSIIGTDMDIDQKCTRKWMDQFGMRYRCIALATEIVNGKHLCKHHANNTLRRQRMKQRIKDGTYGVIKGE